MDVLIKTNPIRQLAAVFLLAMLVFPISAQEKGDSVFPSRLHQVSDKFFAHGMDNGAELPGISSGMDRCEDITPNALVSEPSDIPASVTHSAQPEAAPSAAPSASSGKSGFMDLLLSGDHVVLKTNLLYYAVLMPSIEAEWKFADRWSGALEVQGAWYAKNPPHKVYRIATVIPEARYWVINRSRWHGMYVGAFVGAGLYDLSNGKKKGHEGEGFMAGVSAGYMWPISKHLSLDAGIGVGYLNARDKEYTPADGHFLYQLSKNISYIGPLRLKLSLVWHFQSKNPIGKK